MDRSGTLWLQRRGPLVDEWQQTIAACALSDAARLDVADPIPFDRYARRDNPELVNRRRALERRRLLQAELVRDAGRARSEMTFRRRLADAIESALEAGDQAGHVHGWHVGLRHGLFAGVLAGAALAAGALYAVERWNGTLHAVVRWLA